MKAYDPILVWTFVDTWNRPPEPELNPEEAMAVSMISNGKGYPEIATTLGIDIMDVSRLVIGANQRRCMHAGIWSGGEGSAQHRNNIRPMDPEWYWKFRDAPHPVFQVTNEDLKRNPAIHPFAIAIIVRFPNSLGPTRMFINPGQSALYDSKRWICVRPKECFCSRTAYHTCL